MTTRVHLHDYEAEDLAGILDGAVLMHRETFDLIKGRFDTHRHDLRVGRACVEQVRAEDVVYAGCGPYAALYHFWRQQMGKEFRIVREVHTSFWSGYWTQEELCQPFIRPGDLVLFPTEFTRQLYCRLFPNTTMQNSAVAYPMRKVGRAGTRVKLQKSGDLRIGYIGALSMAKGFDQVLEIVAGCHERSGGKASFHFAGKPNDSKFAAASTLTWLRKAGLPDARVHFYGEIIPENVGQFYEAIDLLLFPGLASRETLGRVVLEALQFNIAVLTAECSPAAELLPSENLIPAHLDHERLFNMGNITALGQLDREAAIERIQHRIYSNGNRVDHDVYGSARFLDLLSDPAGRGPTTDSWDTRIPWGAQLIQRNTPKVLSALERLEGALMRASACPMRLSDMRDFPRTIDAEIWPPHQFRITRLQGLNS